MCFMFEPCRGSRCESDDNNSVFHMIREGCVSVLKATSYMRLWISPLPSSSSSYIMRIRWSSHKKTPLHISMCMCVSVEACWVFREMVWHEQVRVNTHTRTLVHPEALTGSIAWRTKCSETPRSSGFNLHSDGESLLWDKTCLMWSVTLSSDATVYVI